MPIYEYRCSECGFQKEFLRKLSDPPQTVCPQCGKATFSKMLTAAGFQLKGSGWYATDFRNKGAAPAAGTTTGPKDDSKSEAKPETTGGSKAESKPAGESTGGGSAATPAPAAGTGGKPA